MKLLTLGNTKTVKGEERGYMTFIMHLAPSKLSGYNTCPMASKGCAAACLNTAGRGRFDATQEARIRKTRWFFEDRGSFMTQLIKDIEAAIRKAEREGFVPVFRLNGTSDIRWETVQVSKSDTNYTFANIMEMFPGVKFYDYTKIANRKNLPANYHLTFSRSESNDSAVNNVIANTDVNVAVVFSTKKGKPLPTLWNGRPVIDGDEDDLRFLDAPKAIVGLRAKGKAKAGATNDFVVEAE